MIDEKKLKRLIKKWKIKDIDDLRCNFIRVGLFEETIFKESRVPMKSPEQLRMAHKYCDAGGKLDMCDFIDWVLCKPSTWDEIFEKEEKSK